jgi:calcineurin-like phosphoesterase family protein
VTSKPEIWFSSDTHFSHANIITYCDRPFDDVEDMNNALVDNWNACVAPDDIIVHCGDVSMGRAEDTRRYIERLNGRKLLLRGNHDSKKYVRLYRELGWRVFDSLVVNDILIQHHYLEEEHDFEFVIHGHAHGSRRIKKHYDVGVDARRVSGRRDTYGPISSTFLLGLHEEYALRLVLYKML